MAIRLGGIDCKLYRHTAGNYAVPTFDEITLCKDLTAPLGFGEGDATVRGSNGWVMTEPTLITHELNFSLLRDQGHADYLALRNAAIARTAIVLAACTGTITVAGEEYIKAEYKIFKFDEGEPLDGLATIDVVAKPCYPTNAANVPTHVIVA